MDRDHPREYGENPVSRGLPRSWEGPSPRIRGEFKVTSGFGWCVRTIPANTGRIGPVPRRVRGLRDHPREYGENASPAMPTAWPPGPSPRIRGEFRVDVGVQAPHWDHPREYGENNPPDGTPICVGGPSPRIRGECGGRFPIEGV